jgi:nucleotide-binding universal stress UspA family protein
MSWNPVVAGVDNSPEGVLAAAAAWSVAKAAGAAFHLVHVAREVSQLPPVASGALAEEELGGKLQQAARGQVEEALRDRLPAEALEHLEVRQGNTAWVLAGAVRDYAAELLVLGGKRHAAPVRWFGGSTVHHAVRTIDVPILVTASERPLFGRVMVAADLSEAAIPTLTTGARFAGVFGAELCALSVVEPFPPIPDVAVQVDEQEHLRLAEEEFARIVERTPGGTEIPCQVRCGAPGRAIAEEAEAWGADLVVVGSHGKGWVDRVLLGSTTERLLNRLPTSVLVVPVGTRTEQPT